MTTCSVTNSTAISCDYGCCGTADDRTCCEYTLSESVVIVVCVVGALVIVAIVVALIVCLTSKQKNTVTRIHPRQRRNMLDNEPRRRRAEFPKPPPYSEAPPQYETIHVPDESRSTEPILPGGNVSSPSIREQRTNRRQNRIEDVTHPSRIPPDDPPSYISVIRTDQNNYSNNHHYSPEPGTSGMGRVSDTDNMINSVMDRTRHGSPHPSLASGRISASMFNRPAALHKTASERSRRLIGLGNNSVTPVTIREITVHSPVNQNNTRNETTIGRIAGKGKRVNNVFDNQSQIPRRNHRGKIITETENVQTTNDTGNNAVLLPGAFEESSYSPKLDNSPPPRNPAAAARRAQRHAVLHKLQQRRTLASPTPVQ